MDVVVGGCWVKRQCMCVGVLLGSPGWLLYHDNWILECAGLQEAVVRKKMAATGQLATKRLPLPSSLSNTNVHTLQVRYNCQLQLFMLQILSTPFYCDFPCRFLQCPQSAPTNEKLQYTSCISSFIILSSPCMLSLRVKSCPPAVWSINSTMSLTSKPHSGISTSPIFHHVPQNGLRQYHPRPCLMHLKDRNFVLHDLTLAIVFESFIFSSNTAGILRAPPCLQDFSNHHWF